jgi:hypothetical protein
VDFEITEALQDWFKDEISAAYQQGAEDVHNAWIVGNGQSEADFGEAASDYAASRNTQSTAPLIAANEALKQRVAELEAEVRYANAEIEEYQDRENAVLGDISDMMSEFVENWPAPKKVSTAIKLIAKTLRANWNEANEAAAKIAKTGWVSADYNVVGIADADVAMRLCEHIENAILSLKRPTT